MNPLPTEITAQNLRIVRNSHKLTQDEVAALLGLEKSHVSKIESQTRNLSAAEKTVLDWYFFGAVPPKLETVGTDPMTLLEFTEGEWRIIGLLAKRHGMTERQWIGSRIRDYLAVLNQEADAGSPGERLKVADRPENHGLDDLEATQTGTA